MLTLKIKNKTTKIYNHFSTYKTLYIGSLTFLALIIYIFWDLFIAPNLILLGNNYDGLKNYFHFLSYLKSYNESLLMHQNTNYPFGESILFLDIMPFISFFIKISSKIFPWGVENALAIHNLLVIFNLFFCFFFLTLIFRKFDIRNYWSVFLAMIIALTNPMVIRLNFHFALSLSSALVGYLYLLLNFYDAFLDNSKKKLLIFSSLIALWIIVFSFFHFYFFPLIWIHWFFFILFLIIKNKLKIDKVYLFLIPCISIALVWFLMKILDPYALLRPSNGSGFDWQPYNFSLEALLSKSNTPVSIAPFFIEIPFESHYENTGYLGGFTLYSLLIFVFLFLFKLKSFKTINYFVKLNFLASLFLLFISLGSNINFIGQDGLKIKNIFSVFYWGAQVSDTITHFRVLARFSWFFYFAVLFFIIVQWNQLLKEKKWAKYVFIIPFFIGVIDVYEWSKHLKVSSTSKISFEFDENEKNILSKINTKKYSAFIVFPYFQVGTSNLDLTLDDYPPVSEFVYKYTFYSGLPSVNHKASRTPDIFAKHQIDFCKHLLLDSLQQKYNKKYLIFLYKKDYPKLNNFKAENLLYGKWDFIVKKQKMKKISEINDFSIYEFEV